MFDLTARRDAPSDAALGSMYVQRTPLPLHTAQLPSILTIASHPFVWTQSDHERIAIYVGFVVEVNSEDVFKVAYDVTILTNDNACS